MVIRRKYLVNWPCSCCGHFLAMIRVMANHTIQVSCTACGAGHKTGPTLKMKAKT